MKRKTEHFKIIKHARRYDKHENKFIINIAYETAAELTPVSYTHLTLPTKA